MSKGRYAQYDDRALWEHVADKVHEMYDEWPEMKAAALAQSRMETKVDMALVALRPRSIHPAVQVAIAFSAVMVPAALVAIAITVVTFVRTPAARASQVVEVHR